MGRRPEYTFLQRRQTDEWIYQNRNRLTDIENKLVDTSREKVGRDKLGVWD